MPKQSRLLAGSAADAENVVQEAYLRAYRFHYREILLPRDAEELSCRDITGIAGTPMGTVISRLSHAHEALRRSWHGEAAKEMGDGG
jgi:DNA-directed RNA polymerase specialized sigma24 family protein